METTITALAGLVLWSVVLTFVLVFARVGTAMSGSVALNKFRPDGTDLSEAGHRITRAHANSLEYLALPAALMLLAIATGNAAVTAGLAMVYLGCRVAQSVVHIISTAPPMVMIRATLFSVQMVILIIWAIKLTGAVAA
ncbi:MAG: MAPEG family protein [Gammaproteobacteria bacterium]